MKNFIFLLTPFLMFGCGPSLCECSETVYGVYRGVESDKKLYDECLQYYSEDEIWDYECDESEESDKNETKSSSNEVEISLSEARNIATKKCQGSGSMFCDVIYSGNDSLTGSDDYVVTLSYYKGGYDVVNYFINKKGEVTRVTFE